MIVHGSWEISDEDHLFVIAARTVLCGGLLLCGWVIVISSELPDILHVADRVLVMHEGRLTADIPCSEADEETIMKSAVA